MKTSMNLILATILTICGGVSMQAKTVRGTVTEAISGEKLIGATVKVVETGTGSVVDLEGNFRIDIPQSGRYTLETSYVGYEPNVMKEVLMADVKEVVIDIQLRENNTELTEVEVRPRVNKEATVNPSVLTGGVMLSMEEASRFAGGYNDQHVLLCPLREFQVRLTAVDFLYTEMHLNVCSIA